MTPTLELVSVQYALALLIGQDLDLRVKTCVIIDSTIMLNSSRHGRCYAV
jgi:hypothetical protein